MVSPLTRKLRRDIARHKAQFIAVAITMFLGVTLFAASYDSFQNLQASYSETHTEFRFANLTIAGGDVAAVANDVSSIDGVESAQLRTVLDVPLQADGTKLLGRVVGLPSADQPTVNQVQVAEGRYLDASRPDAVLVEQHMADHFGLEPGDSVAVLGPDGWIDAEVVGVVASPEYIWPSRDRQNVITSPDNFGVLFGGEGLIIDLGAADPNELAVYYTGGKPNDELTATISRAAWSSGATSVQTRDQQASNAALEEDLAGFEEMALFFPVLFLVAASMAAYVTINRLVATQRPYIGVLLANGYTRRQVLRHYLGYGLLPGLIGSVPGAIAGVLLARLITSMYTDLLAIPITLIEFYPVTLAAAIAFGLLASLLAALAPALVASRVEPALAMRGETPAGRGRASFLERLIPPLRKLPLTWRMALRGVERNPRRTAYTIIGVVLSLTLVLVSWGMIDTIEHLMDRQFVQIQREDAAVHFAAPIDIEDVVALEAIDGIAEAEPVLELPVSFASGDRHYDTVLVAMEAGTTMHRFAGSNGDWIELPDDGVLAGSAFEDLLEVAPGDAVDVTIGDLGLSLETTVSEFVHEPLGTMSYVARDQAETLTGGPLPATSALIRYADGADPDTIRAIVTELPQVAAFEDAKAIYNVMQDLMVLFYAFVGVMLVFGAAMAFALIFSAMSVNISERSREMATLLAVGTERRAISRFITAENMLVALPGIPLGLVAGYFMSKEAMATFSSDLFAFDLYVKPSTFVFAALAIVIVALLSQLPGLRAVRRIDIPRFIKERSA
jgi:putative ABC transport system permease protein